MGPIAKLMFIMNTVNWVISYLPSTLVCSLQTFCFFPQQCRPAGCDSVGNHYKSSGPQPRKKRRRRYTSLNSMKRNWRKSSWIPGFRRRKWWLCLWPVPSGRASHSCWISSWDILVQRYEIEPLYLGHKGCYLMYTLHV